MTAPAARADSTQDFHDAALELFRRQHATIASVLAAYGEAAIGEGAAHHALELLVGDYADGPFHEEWARTFDGLLQDAVDRGAAPVAQAARFDFRLYDRAVQDAIDARAEQLAGFVGNTTAGLITDAYRTVRDSGGSAQDLARKLSADVFDEATISARSLTIAATESAIGINTGAQLAAEQSGVIRTKTWRHDGNPREPRDWHVDMDGETVALSQSFSNGLAYPCDPSGPPEEVINCTCTADYSTDGAEERR